MVSLGLEQAWEERIENLIDTSKIKSADDLREQLSRLPEKGGRVQTLLNHADEIFEIDSVQNKVSNNWEEEIQNTTYENIDTISIPSDVENRAELQAELESIKAGIERSIEEQEAEIESKEEAREVRQAEREMIEKIEGRKIKNLRLYYV